jgi:hypothetical protein
MAWFHVFLRGEHFLVHRDGKDAWMDFFKNIYVEADSEDIATELAIKRLSSNDAFRASVRNPPDKPPALNIEEVNRIDADPSLKDSDFVYFPDETMNPG